MSASSGIQPDLVEKYKFNYIVELVGVKKTAPGVLIDIWNMGTSKASDQTIEDYFLTTKKMSPKIYKFNFYGHEREKNKSVNVKDFDVGHLYKIIKFGSDKLDLENKEKRTTKNDNQLEYIFGD